MLIDKYSSDENTSEVARVPPGNPGYSFNDGYDFNAWQLNPAFPEPYRAIIGKDAALSNITGREHLEFIELNLRRGVYLTGFVHRVQTGYKVTTDKNPEGYTVATNDLNEAMRAVPEGEQLRGVAPHFDAFDTFPKSVHGGKSKAYTRMALTRGIGGRASRDLITVRQEQDKTLREETARRSWLTGQRKPSSEWAQMEYRK